MTTPSPTVNFAKFPRWLLYYTGGAMLLFTLGLWVLFMLLFDGFGDVITVEDTQLYLIIGGAIVWGWILDSPFFLGIMFAKHLQSLSPEQQERGVERYLPIGLLIPLGIGYAYWFYWDFLIADLFLHLILPVIGVTILYVLPLLREMWRLRSNTF